MATSFLVVPQWQGSVSARAMRLVDGAEAIRGDLPSGATRTVEVPLEAGDSLGSGIERLSSIVAVRDRMVDALRTAADPVIVIGGDCGIELAAITHAARADTAIVWFDAHGDLNTPESSHSHAFAGMVLRTLLGDGHESIVPAHPVDASRVVLAGARSIDPAEAAFIADHRIQHVTAAAVSPETLVAAVSATGATSVYLHLDLDVLDPAAITGLSLAEPFGVDAGTLVETVRAIVSRFDLVGAGITQFAPTSPTAAVDDSPTILRLIGALTAR